MLHSKLNKIEEWSLYCFMIFRYWKVNDIKGPAVLASQIHRFIISLLQILLFYIISALKERKTRKRKTNMATEKIDMTDLFDKLVTTYKQTHVSVNGQQAQIECSRLWREINNGKENATTEFKAQKLMFQLSSQVINHHYHPMLKTLLKSLLLPHLRYNKLPRRLMQFLLRLCHKPPRGLK